MQIYEMICIYGIEHVGVDMSLFPIVIICISRSEYWFW